jgi:prephenate dehydrogenase
MRLAILGFGLIGGSVARALHERDPDGWSTVAWSPSGRATHEAAAEGTIAAAAPTPAAAVDGADLVLIAAPPLACLELLDSLAGALRPRLPSGAAITDVASTKRRLVARAAELGLPFVGGHPMAGLEATGYAAAVPDLFVGRPWVLCGGDDASVEAVRPLAVAVGARPLRMDAGEHDAAVAAISHLPLVLSAALTEAVTGGHRPGTADPRRLAAGGWASMTRLARGDPEMGAGILATNADEVARRLRTARAVIDEWLALLETEEPDAEAIRDRLTAARAALEWES